MTKALVKKQQDALAVQITKEDIKNYFCPLATDKEVFMALGIINSLNLNPHTKEVHLVKYDSKSPLSIVVGYEVYLKRAQRSGKLKGWTAGISKDGKTAFVKIKRADWDEPFEWEILLSEFSKNQATWKQIPNFMGKKVAIAQGFRLCFPDELGEMPYTSEEHQVYDIDVQPKMKPEVDMPKEIKGNTATNEDKNVAYGGTDKVYASTETEVVRGDITDKTIKDIHVLAGKLWGKDWKAPYKEKLFTATGKDSCTELSEVEGDNFRMIILTELNEMVKNRKKK